MNYGTETSDDELREIHKASGKTLILLIDCLSNRPDMEEAVRRLMSPDDMLETFSEFDLCSNGGPNLN